MEETGGNGSGPKSPVLSARDPRARRAERLVPIVHDLLDWELVVRTESGAFVLADDVQQRLQTAVERQSRPGTQVYFGRPCQRCGTSGITRLIQGVRLCAPCTRLAAEAAATPVPAEPAAEPATATERPRAGHRKPHTWRLRKVG